jgi:hypothetical protein
LSVFHEIFIGRNVNLRNESPCPRVKTDAVKERLYETRRSPASNPGHSLAEISKLFADPEP